MLDGARYGTHTVPTALSSTHVAPRRVLTICDKPINRVCCTGWPQGTRTDCAVINPCVTCRIRFKLSEAHQAPVMEFSKRMHNLHHFRLRCGSYRLILRLLVMRSHNLLVVFWSHLNVATAMAKLRLGVPLRWASRKDVGLGLASRQPRHHVDY